MKSEWITHAGKRIFFCHYENMDVESLRQEVDEVDALMVKEAPDSIYCITDMRGTSGSPAVVDIFKKSTTKTKAYIHRSAAVGIGYAGARKKLFDLVMKISGQNVTLFDSVEKALEWLVGDDR